jgi:electron-transferring-flavoprotein dehydrogenase
LIKKFNLRELRGAMDQTYALGIKEVWKVSPEKHVEGSVEHTIGYPLDKWTYGGSFIYHMSDQRVALGLVVGLDYWNTYLSPFHEFQRFKSHPHVRKLLDGGECLEYGARALNEGALSDESFHCLGNAC